MVQLPRPGLKNNQGINVKNRNRAPLPNRVGYRTKHIPVRITFVDRNSNIASQPHANFNKLLTFPCNHATQSSNLPTSGGRTVDDAARTRPKEFGLKLLLSNTMSLALKIDEIRCCVLDWKPDVACFTETWLHDSINDNHIYIPEYNFITKNRTTDIHGGVGLYIKNSIKFRLLGHLQVNNMEVLWVWLRSKRLPRGVPSVIIGTIYHPPNADDSEMLDYLFTTLTIIEGQYPGCGIFLAGDFSRLDVSRLSTQFRMIQLVCSPTRGDRILDLILTNLPQLYDRNSVKILPQFGLSDHNVGLLHPKVRSPKEGPSRKVITKRDTRTSKKLELGRYLNSIKWSTVDSLLNCEDKLELMKNFIHNGLNYIMPIHRKEVLPMDYSKI